MAAKENSCSQSWETMARWVAHLFHQNKNFTEVMSKTWHREIKFKKLTLRQTCLKMTGWEGFCCYSFGMSSIEQSLHCMSNGSCSMLRLFLISWGNSMSNHTSLCCFELQSNGCKILLNVMVNKTAWLIWLNILCKPKRRLEMDVCSWTLYRNIVQSKY